MTVVGLLAGIGIREYAFHYRTTSEDPPFWTLSKSQWLVPALTSFLFACVSAAGIGIWATVALSVLVIGLVTLSVIDFECLVLPDNITIPGIWVGLGLSTTNLFTDAASSILGAIIGYVTLALMNLAARLVWKRDGIGGGDWKLLALLGAWFGWQSLPVTLISSVILGALVGMFLLVARKHKLSVPMPFGPFIVLGGLISLFWGEKITTWCLTMWW